MAPEKMRARHACKFFENTTFPSKNLNRPRIFQNKKGTKSKLNCFCIIFKLPKKVNVLYEDVKIYLIDYIQVKLQF